MSALIHAILLLLATIDPVSRKLMQVKDCIHLHSCKIETLNSKCTYLYISFPSAQARSKDDQTSDCIVLRFTETIKTFTEKWM
ncbi:hypothetical protein GDO78_015601 [Eleutherodactylus coqui]|uniref:Secreted protein n=1 Tax=Eleutherodactylus coqui TaxID=57060 RepID=A0A8J6ENW0_ELECQ|nr:hypothetical protein GDO78_015601 [Eleutherodactylus coqui]